MDDAMFQQFAEQVEAAVNEAIAPFVPEPDDFDVDEKLRAIIAVLFCAAIWRVSLLQKPGGDIRDDVAKIVDLTITENAELLARAAGEMRAL